MAFNIKKRIVVAKRDTTTTTTTTTTTENNVVATESWVKKLLAPILAWTSSFKTSGLQVTGPAQTESLQTTSLQADEIKTNSLTILDKNGNPMNITIGDDGELLVTNYYSNIFVYPTTDLDIRTFFYTMGKTVVDNFNYQTPQMLMQKFIPFVDATSTDYNGVTCYKLCSSDGEDAIVDRTMLFSCDTSHYISKVIICDEDMNAKTQVWKADDKNVRMLTINMPYFASYIQNEDGTTTEKDSFAELPMGYECLETVMSDPLPPPQMPLPVLPPVRLSPDLFEDNPPPPAYRLGIPGASIEDCICGKPWSGHLKEQTSETLATSENGVKYGAYVTDTYENIVLKRSDFTKNAKQFLKVVVESV